MPERLCYCRKNRGKFLKLGSQHCKGFCFISRQEEESGHKWADGMNDRWVQGYQMAVPYVLQPHYTLSCPSKQSATALRRTPLCI